MVKVMDWFPVELGLDVLRSRGALSIYCLLREIFLRDFM